MTSSALDVPFTPDLHEVERLAVELVTDAADAVAAAFGRQIEVQQKPYKDGTQPVTALDRSIEQTVGAAVRTRYPEHAVVGEEFGNVGEERDWCWIVDPIDGTHNFVNGVPMFAVSLGVLFRRRPVVGAIAVPANQSVLHGQIGGPVNLGGDPVEVSQAQMPSPASGWCRLTWSSRSTRHTVLRGSQVTIAGSDRPRTRWPWWPRARSTSACSTAPTSGT